MRPSDASHSCPNSCLCPTGFELNTHPLGLTDYLKVSELMQKSRFVVLAFLSLIVAAAFSMRLEQAAFLYGEFTVEVGADAFLYV